jgi:hypothetical protein
VSESLARAFPARLAPSVTSVIQSLPAARFGPSKPVTASYSRAWAGLVVAGEPVVIPYRVYNPVPPPHLASGLSRTERDVTAAIYSRHHDGHVRQRALRALLDCDEPWTAPFFVQLLGEYVIQICADIEKFTQTALPARLAMQASLSAFLMQNPCFAELTRQRAISYWSCYQPGPARLSGHLSSAHSALKAQRQLGSLNREGQARFGQRADRPLRPQSASIRPTPRSAVTCVRGASSLSGWQPDAGPRPRPWGRLCS